jgi:predicted NUDIX family NTP pyrophosphohydrolase
MIESAGILVYKKAAGELQFLLVHPGGPFFAKRDEGYWTVPKGLVEEGEDRLTTAKREFLEETGIAVSGNFLDLGYIVQKGGKRVHCFGVAFDLDPSTVVSNTFEVIWPPKSGRLQSFPEIDRAVFFDFETACIKINERQVELLKRLIEMIE